MARKKRTKAAANSPNPKVALRWALRLLPVAALLVITVMICQRIEAFLIEDARFQLGAAEEYGATSPNIRVRGVVNASPDRILKVFAEDTGRSLYLFPQAERRLRLLAINWVKDAAVSRIWPNRVEVLIRERRPVAFVRVTKRGRRSRALLIDQDGVLLKPPTKSRYDLPVLVGVTEEQSEPMRSVRVRRAMSMLADLGPLAAEISEIDVSDQNNLTVSESVAGHPVVLMLGRQNFRRRLKNFLAHYPEIQRRLPAAKTFDLRLDDRITAMDGVNRKG